ncbi:hypothetical protein HY090_00405 [Candidatus Kaiserbacteria bacterium]|nr:hypothetical protein [Candidatus Kaiserbacteria bacterium]
MGSLERKIKQEDKERGENYGHLVKLVEAPPAGYVRVSSADTLHDPTASAGLLRMLGEYLFQASMANWKKKITPGLLGEIVGWQAGIFGMADGAIARHIAIVPVPNKSGKRLNYLDIYLNLEGIKTAANKTLEKVAKIEGSQDGGKAP